MKKIMKLTSIFVLSFCLFFSLACAVIPAYATEPEDNTTTSQDTADDEGDATGNDTDTTADTDGQDTQQIDPYVNIEVLYSSDITPKEGDIFSLTYKIADTEETAQIELDAYELRNELGILTIPQANYVITDIAYQGNNSAISKGVYAVTSSFTSSTDGTHFIRLAIGYSESIQMDTTYSDVILHQGGAYVTSLTPESDTDASQPADEAGEQPTDTPETTDPSDEEPSDTDTGTSKPEDQPTVDDYTQEVEKENDDTVLGLPKGTMLGKAIPICVIGVVGTTALIVIYKKKIL